MPAIVSLPAPPRAAIVQVDVRACHLRTAAPMGRSLQLPPGAVAIDANYYWKGRPIGALLDNGKIVPHTQVNRPRALLIVEEGRAKIDTLTPQQIRTHLKNGDWKKATVIQAGPELIRDGQILPRSTQQKEGFRPGVYRRTSHTAIGITRSGKLLFVFAYDRTLSETAWILKKAGAVHAINLDGGSSASLRMKGRSYGIRHPRTVLIATPIRV